MLQPVRPSICPSCASDFLETGKPQNLTGKSNKERKSEVKYQRSRSWGRKCKKKFRAYIRKKLSDLYLSFTQYGNVVDIIFLDKTASYASGGVFIRSKGQKSRSLERQSINRFSRLSSSKVDRFIQIYDQHDQRSILYMSSDTVHQRKCSFWWYLSLCLSHTSHTFRLLFIQYWNAVENSYFMEILLFTLVNGEVIGRAVVRSKCQRSRSLGRKCKK